MTKKQHKLRIYTGKDRWLIDGLSGGGWTLDPVRLNLGWQPNHFVGLDYEPAGDAFDEWSRLVHEDLTYEGHKLIRLYWSVQGFSDTQQLIQELAPFNIYNPAGEPGEDYLSYYSWPIHAETGERLNWNRLPVVDNWEVITPVTGFVPSPLQPFVPLRLLTEMASQREMTR